MANLTSNQQKLIDSLINEFSTSNNTNNTTNKRFTLDTIDSCITEQEKFKNDIAKHNIAMIDLLIKDLNKEVNSFKKEFGKKIKIQIGRDARNCDWHTLEHFIEKAKKNPNKIEHSTEVPIYFISDKTKRFHESSYDYFEGKSYAEFFIRFVCSTEEIVLESGKKVYSDKITRLVFKNKYWLHEDHSNFIHSRTLDLFIQNNKEIQQKLVEILN